MVSQDLPDLKVTSGLLLYDSGLSACLHLFVLHESICLASIS